MNVTFTSRELEVVILALQSSADMGAYLLPRYPDGPQRQLYQDRLNVIRSALGAAQEALKDQKET